MSRAHRGRPTTTGTSRSRCSQPFPRSPGAPIPKQTQEEQDTFAAVVAAIDSIETDPGRHLSIQIDQSIRDAIQAAQASGQGASVSIAIKVKPGLGRRMSFVANVNAKLPRPPVATCTLFADAEGNVHQSDPAQQRLEFYDSTQQLKKEI